jgi:hypothetical protein
MDPRKKLSQRFLYDAPGCGKDVDRCIFEGHYYKSLVAARNAKENRITDQDRVFISEALRIYADSLLEWNFWDLAHLAKKRPIADIDPVLADALYSMCLNIDEFKALLYFDSAHIVE